MPGGPNPAGGPDINMNRDDRNSKKPYVWLHPPKDTELSIHDELFVLCDRNPKEMHTNSDMGKSRGNDVGQA